MRKTAFILLILIWPLLSFAQDSVLISGNYEQVLFKDLVEDLESRYDLRFFYEPDLDSALITLQFESRPLSELIGMLTRASGINFYQQDSNTLIASGQFIIQPQLDAKLFEMETETAMPPPDESNSILTDIRETVQTNRINQLESQLTEIGIASMRFDGNTATMAGYLRDANTGEPIVGASVFKKDPLVGAITDPFGYYSLTLPKGRHEVFFTSTGMRSTRRQVALYSDGELNVELIEDIISLKEVVVSGERDLVDNLQTGFASLNIKTIKEVPTVMGEADIMKVALTLPGVQTVGENAAGFNVRGGSADQNLVLLGDVPVYNTNHLFGFFSVFNPDVIANANLYKSGIGAHYGGRISSVFDVSMREGNKKRTIYQGGISPVTAKFSIEGPIKKDTTSYILGLRTTYSDWILSLLNDPELRNSSGAFSDVAAKVSHTINERNRLTLSGYYSRDRFRLNTDSLYKYHNGNASLQWRHTFSNRLQAIASGSLANYNFSLSSESNPVNAFLLYYRINQYTGKIDFNYFPVERLNIKFGGTTTLYDLQPGERSPLGDTSIVETVRLAGERGRESALYAGAEYELNPKVSFYGGLRLSVFNRLGPGESFTYLPGAPVETNFITDTIAYGKNESIKRYVNPELRASARYKLTNYLSFKVSYDRLNQYIHVLSNTTSISPVDAWRLSGESIKPQTSDQYSAGLYKTFVGTSLEVSVEGYYKKLRNVLEYKDGSDLLLNEVIETEVIGAGGKSYGVEFLLRKQSGKFTGWLSYTYARAFLQTSGTFPREQINGGDFYSSNFDRPHTAALVSNFKLNRRINLSLNMNYSTGRPTTFPIAQYEFRNEPRLVYTNRNQSRIPDYFRTDIAINLEGNHRVNKKIHGSWSLSIYNLTSRANAYSVFFRSEGGEIKGYKLSIFKEAIPTITYHFRRN